MTNQKNELVKKPTGLSVSDPNAIFTQEGINTTMMVCKQFMISGAVPSSFKTPEAVMMVVQAGRELGMKPIESINGMMIINGQIKLWGTALSARVTRLGYKINWKETTKQKASVTVTDPDGNETGVEEYTEEDAKGANLIGKGAWCGHQKTMLRWRALSNCIKFNYPHLLQGISVVEDDDDLNHEQGGDDVEIEDQDNASKLINKRKEVEVVEIAKDDDKKMSTEEVKDRKKEVDEKVVKGEIVEKPKEKPMTKKALLLSEKISKTEIGNARLLFKKTGTLEANVLAHFELKKLEDMTNGQAIEMCEVLNQKKEATEKPAPTGNELTPNDGSDPIPVEKEEESPGAKSMREAREKKDNKAEVQETGNGIPSDVCQYINSIELVEDKNLSEDIIELKKDSNKGIFKGYDVYPTLKEKIAKMIKTREDFDKEVEDEINFDEATKDINTSIPDIVPVDLEIVKLSNQLLAKGSDNLSPDEQRFCNDVTMESFRGKDHYKGVKF